MGLRLLALVVLLPLFGLAPAGCGGTETVKTVTETIETQPPAESAPAETSSPTETESDGSDEVAQVGGAITLRGSDEGAEVKVTLLDYRPRAQAANEFLEPGAGKRYVAVRLRIENVGSAIYDDSPSNGSAVIDREDQQFDATLDAVEPGLGSPTIRPGDARVGWISFEVPAAAKLRTFQFTLDSGFGPEAGEWSLG